MYILYKHNSTACLVSRNDTLKCTSSTLRGVINNTLGVFIFNTLGDLHINMQLSTLGGVTTTPYF